MVGCRFGRGGRAVLVAASMVLALLVGAPPSVASASPDPAASSPPPVVGPEHPVADPVMGIRTGDQSQVAVASDGDGFLVAWRDDHQRAIVATRVTADGEILDPAGIAVGHGEVADPAVSWDGTNYLVVWCECDRLRGALGVLATRVTPEGAVLDPDPIPVATGGGQGSPAVAFNGTHHLVAWDAPGARGSWDIHAARIDVAGTVVDPGGIPVATGPHHQTQPAVASDGRDFLVAWSQAVDRHLDSGHIFATRVNGDGAVRNGKGFAVSTGRSDPSEPAVAWDGAHYLVVWSDDRAGGHADVLGARVSPSGRVGGAEIAVATGPGHDRSPSVAGTGDGAYVVWYEAPTTATAPGSPPPWSVLGRRVAEGAVTGAPVRIGTGSQPAVASNGSDHLVPWSVEKHVLPGACPPADDVYAARVTSDGSLLDDPALHLTPQANSQGDPAVAWNGRTHLVAWVDGRPRPDASGPLRYYFARVGATGQSRDGAGIALPPGPTWHGVTAASNGDGFLLAWIAGDGIGGVRIDADGNLLDREPFTVSAPGALAAHSLSVASDGDGYLAVWQYDGVDEAYRPHVVGARIPAAGPPGGPVVTISRGEAWWPALACNGVRSLVAGRQVSSDAQEPPAGRGPGIAGVRVDRAGNVLDSRPLFVPEGDEEEFSRPGVAAGDGAFLMAWNNRARDYSRPTRTEGVRVHASGEVLDPSPVALATGTSSYARPRLSWNGANYLLVWMPAGPAYNDVLGARISQAGTVLDPDGFVIARSPDLQRQPAVTDGPNRRNAVAYVRQVWEAPYYGAQRVFLRFVDQP